MFTTCCNKFMGGGGRGQQYTVWGCGDDWSLTNLPGGAVYVLTCIRMLRWVAYHFRGGNFSNSSDGNILHDPINTFIYHPWSAAGVLTTPPFLDEFWNQVTWDAVCVVHPHTFSLLVVSRRRDRECRQFRLASPPCQIYITLHFLWLSLILRSRCCWPKSQCCWRFLAACRHQQHPKKHARSSVSHELMANCTLGFMRLRLNLVYM